MRSRPYIRTVESGRDQLQLQDCSLHIFTGMSMHFQAWHGIQAAVTIRNDTPCT